MRIDNRRWFIVTICLPFLGFVAFFSAFLVLESIPHHADPLEGILLMLWVVTAACCTPVMTRAMQHVSVRSRAFVQPEKGLYRMGSVLLEEVRELEHCQDVFGVVFWLLIGPITTTTFMIFVACGNEIMFRKHIVHEHLFISTSSFFIACGLVCMLAHAIIVILTRRRVIKEALRVFHHRRSLQTDSV